MGQACSKQYLLNSRGDPRWRQGLIQVTAASEEPELEAMQSWFSFRSPSFSLHTPRHGGLLCA